MQGQSPQQQLRAVRLGTCLWSFYPGASCVLRLDHVWAWRLDPDGTETASLETSWETKLPARAPRPDLGWGWGGRVERNHLPASGDPENCECYIPESLGRASRKPGLRGDGGRQQPVMAWIGW